MSVYHVAGCGCVNNAAVYGLDESIARAKYPMSVDVSRPTADLTDGIKALAQSQKGEGHDQWLTGVVVQFDLTFSVKAYTEAERYHFLDFVSSQSTMHRITKFDLDKSYNEYVDERIVDIMKKKINEYNGLLSSVVPDDLEHTLEHNAKLNEKYLEILYSNPTGFLLTAGMTTNYRQLKTIYAQRKQHRLPEWREFCKWIETLPHSELIVGEINEK